MFEREVKMSAEQWKAETKVVDGFVKEIEGSDERTYEEDKKTK